MASKSDLSVLSTIKLLATRATGHLHTAALRQLGQGVRPKKYNKALTRFYYDVKVERLMSARNALPRSTSCLHSTSQFFQDIFVLEMLDFKRNGFFIEVGVGEGIVFSNTYLLETGFGWNGILVEPDTRVSESIRRTRKAPLDVRAAYSRTGETVSFLRADVQGHSTIAEFSTGDDIARLGTMASATTVTLNEMLVQYKAPNTIDYLSVDCEGSELEVFEGLDFDRWNVRVITVEHNHRQGRLDAYDKLILPRGFVRLHEDISNVDAWYAKRAE